MANICRLCLSTTPPSSIISVYKDCLSAKEQIKYLLPEIDMDLTSTFHLCNICGNLLQTTYNFVRTCRETEETIKNYITQCNSTPVNLDEVQKFQSGHLPVIHVDSSQDVKIEMYDMEIKTEISSVDVVEEMIDAFVCDTCHKTFEDEQMIGQHRAGCFSLKGNDCGKQLHTKEEYDKHCPSRSILVANHFTIDLHKVDKSQIENYTVTRDIPEDVITRQPNLEMKIEIQNTNQESRSDKYHKYFTDETMKKESGNSLISQKLEDVKVESLTMEKTVEKLQKESLFYKCDLCEKILVRKNEYDTHRETHSLSETQTNLVSNKSLQHGCESDDRNLDSLIEESNTCDTSQSGFSFEMKLKNDNLTHETSPEKHCNFASHIEIKHGIDGYYKCQTCDISFKRKGTLTRHIQTKHEIDRPYKCPTCDMSFKWKSHLRRHIECKHEISRPYECQTCDMSFNQKSRLTRHILYQHQIDGRYKCQNCDMIFERKSILADHIKCKHEIDRRFKCQMCGMSFERKATLTRHTQCRHEIDRPYKCQTCDMSFKRQSTLKDHIKCKHEINRPHTCQTCGKNFKLRSHLTGHIKFKHEMDKRYKCQKCDVSFDLKNLLRDHIKYKHKIDRPYKCDTCGIGFAQKSHWADHIKCKHEIERPYKCQSCSMSFKRKGTLTRHIQSKHEMDRPHKCKICDKSFVVPFSLKVHVESHAKPNEKLFQCSYQGCDRRFRSEAVCSIHLGRHKKPHHCETCGKGFSCKSALRVHMILHTRGTPIRYKCRDKAVRTKNHLGKHQSKDQNIVMVKVEETKIIKEEPPLSPS